MTLIQILEHAHYVGFILFLYGPR